MAKILGVKIDNVSFQEVMAKIQAFLMVDGCKQIATVNAEFVMAAQKDEKFKEILNQADLSVPDGFGIKCAGWWLSQKIDERITGVDLTWEICKIATEKGYSVYFLGAAEGVAQKAANNIELIYPDLKIAGTYSGFPDEEGIVNKINDANPDILFVAFGAPKQEKFIYLNKHSLKVKLCMGVGGTFDYIAGIVPYAPAWVRKLGLESFYRLFTQPKRWKRIFTATIVFPLVIFISRFKINK